MIIDNGYRAALFDLDGTILHSQPTPISHFFKFCHALGQPIDSDAPRRLERWQHEYWANQSRVDADLAEHGSEKFWTVYNIRQLEVAGIRGSLELHVQGLDHWFRTAFVYNPVVDDGTRRTLQRLRGQGLTVGLVSNRREALDDVVNEHGLQDCFDFTLSAGQANSWKPDVGIFNRALSMAGANAEHAVYVGDNYYADVLGARQAGLTPVLIDPRNIFPDADCAVITGIDQLAAP